MKIKSVRIIPCSKCGRINVEHHAKGMCKQCYYRIYMQKYNEILQEEKRLAGIKSKIGAVDKLEKD